MARFPFIALICALPLLAFAQIEPQPSRPDWAPFLHGVASGDPLTDRVIIWTHVTPDSGSTGSITVDWKVATDVALSNVVQSGSTTTDASVDYTVKVDVTGLASGTTYYYEFTALERPSLTGRTKTAPANSESNHLKFGVISCASFQDGYFNAYEALAQLNDLDAVIHVGDYIYENYRATGGLAEERPMAPPNRLTTLSDYRMRYASYRLDTNLIRMHQQHPMLAVWDDHEFSDNVYRDGAGSHDPDRDGPWEARKAAAKQAYFEWMPIRINPNDPIIYRTISYGNLADIILLDTRLEGREEQFYDPFDNRIQEPDRTILGAPQKEWLLDQLSGSSARWKVIAQQVPFAPLELGWSAALDQDPSTTYAGIQGATLDAWNGYPAERRQLLGFIDSAAIEDVVILTGSYHVSLAFEVSPEPVLISFADSGEDVTPSYTTNPAYDPATGAGALAVEFATPSITSNNFDENFGEVVALASETFVNQNVPLIGNPNPHLKFADLDRHGYYLLDIKTDSTQANWYFAEKNQPNRSANFETAYYTFAGEHFLRASDQPSPAKAQQDAPAPPEPQQATTSVDRLPSLLAAISLQPNPTNGIAQLRFSLLERAPTQVMLFSAEGKRLQAWPASTLAAGDHQLSIDLSGFPNGTFFLQLEIGKERILRKVVHQP